ncbi:MAG: hypothetical protein JXM79_15270 [Sedimentisphaerales bacterium]|nr:hypothetical protein [Sedimentisphaerales bacterium]
MKTAIFTLTIGDPSGFIPCMLSVRNYARRHHIRYFISTRLDIRFYAACFEKFQGFKLFNMGFDRVLFLDRDVIVTPDAPNIFDHYPDMDSLYAFDENFPFEHMNRDHIVSAVKNGIDWPKNNHGKYRYFNAGIFIVGKSVKDLIDGYRNRQLYSIPEMRIFHEQTCLNYFAAQKQIKFGNLDCRWNRMDLMQPDPQGERYNAQFIHYAGSMAFVPNEEKIQTIHNDFVHLYGEDLLAREGSVEAFQLWSREHDPFISDPSILTQSTKTCSIVFPGAEDPFAVNQYLRRLPAEQLPPDYELLLFDDSLPETTDEYMDSFQAHTKNISVIFDLDFDQFCTEIARQAEGEYVLFVNRPIDNAQVFQAVDQLQQTSNNAAMDEERNFIIVRRQPLIDAGGFTRL